MTQPLETQSVSEDRPPQLLRGFSFRSALSLAFADVSPIAAVYAIFTLGLFAAGPKFFWAFPIVLIGQLLVAAVFGELASRWPYAGSVYQWSRHVRGTTWGWAAAWAYMWGLTLALGTLSYAASGFLLQIFGVSEPNRWQIATVAICIIAFGTMINMVGRKFLKIVVAISITCEVVGSLGLGAVLLLFYRENPFSVLFSSAGIPDADSWVSGPMLLAIAYVGWSFLGFEAAGSVADEVDEPDREVLGANRRGVGRGQLPARRRAQLQSQRVVEESRQPRPVQRIGDLGGDLVFGHPRLSSIAYCGRQRVALHLGDLRQRARDDPHDLHEVLVVLADRDDRGLDLPPEQDDRLDVLVPEQPRVVGRVGEPERTPQPPRRLQVEVGSTARLLEGVARRPRQELVVEREQEQPALALGPGDLLRCGATPLEERSQLAVHRPCNHLVGR